MAGVFNPARLAGKTVLIVRSLSSSSSSSRCPAWLARSLSLSSPPRQTGASGGIGAATVRTRSRSRRSTDPQADPFAPLLLLAPTSRTRPRFSHRPSSLPVPAPTSSSPPAAKPSSTRSQPPRPRPTRRAARARAASSSPSPSTCRTARPSRACSTGSLKTSRRSMSSSTTCVAASTLLESIPPSGTDSSWAGPSLCAQAGLVYGKEVVGEINEDEVDSASSCRQSSSRRRASLRR